MIIIRLTSQNIKISIIEILLKYVLIYKNLHSCLYNICRGWVGNVAKELI